MAEHGVADRRLAELPRHRDLLRMIEMLVAEEDDLPFQESVAHLLHLRRRQRLGQIDTADFRTDMQGQRYDFDALRRLPGQGHLFLHSGWAGWDGRAWRCG